jgi:ribonuclease HI
MSDRSAIHHEVYVDGAGMRPDGTGSGYAWINAITKRQAIKWLDGLTNNEAEYRGLIFSLRSLPANSRAIIHSDSQLMVYQFSGRFAVRQPALGKLLAKAREVIQCRQLHVTLLWIPREENLAGSLLDRARREVPAS